MNIFGIGVRATDEGESAWVVQIGAHIGFEANDPLGSPNGFQKHQKQSTQKTQPQRKTPENVVPVDKNNTFEVPKTSKELTRQVFSKFELS